jgi:ADP-ribose pyrophosphatase YjhB (NUDIX family)
MKHKVTIGSFGIITDKHDRVLLCHRKDYDFWNLPGGGLEKGESPWNSVIREIKEETGLVAEVINLTGVYSKPKRDEIVFLFECKIISGKLILSDESDKIEYFNLKDLPKNTVLKHVERIKDYFDRHSKTLLKVQQGKSCIELAKEGKL